MHFVPVILGLSTVTLASATPAKLSKRCTFVEQGFISKDCGNAPTNEAFAAFLQNQTEQVAQLKQTLPCGFTSCPKMKRDTEFSYNKRDDLTSDTQAVGSTADGTLYAFGSEAPPAPATDRRAVKRQDLTDDSQPVGSTSDGTLYAFGSQAPPAPASNRKGKRQDLTSDSGPVGASSDGTLYPFGSQAPPAPVTNDKRALSDGEDLDEDELVARNLPVTRGADGRLRLFAARHVPKPVERDDIAAPTDADAVQKRDVVDEYKRALAEVDATDEDELIRRNLPVGRDENGKLYLFGTRSPAKAII